jgi:spermidine synthase
MFSASITSRVVKPLELLDQTVSPDGTIVKLMRRGDEHLILANEQPLMSSRMHGSEETLAELACRRPQELTLPTILIGGLGMGFTLRAALNLLPPSATVIVTELIPAVVAWNRGPLGPVAAHPLNDPRAHIEVGDVAVTLNSSRARFDAILLDVDNGPTPFTASNNAALYDDQGIAAAYLALKTNGVLAVWSAREDRKFEERLRRAKFTVEVHQVRARQEKRGPRHTIFHAHKTKT